MFNLRKISILFISVLVTFIVITAPNSVVYADGQLVDHVEVVDGPGRLKLTIHFITPVRYISHTPARKGKIMQVFFKDIIGGAVDGREQVRWPHDSNLPIEDIYFESGASGNPNLFIAFTKAVEFELLMAEDLRSMTLLIKSGATTTSISPPPPVQVNKVDQPQQKPPEKTKKIVYAITLESSVKPYLKDELPVLVGFEEYKVYSSRYQKNGLLGYKLRVGYFENKSEAKEALLKLKGRYPQAKVVFMAQRRGTQPSFYAINLDSDSRYTLASLPKQPDQLAQVLDFGSEWLFSSPDDLAVKSAADKDVLPEQRRHQLYVTRFKTDDGRVSKRLRLGFFMSKIQAQKTLATLAGKYPYAWVTKVAAAEKKQAERQALATLRYQATSVIAIIESTQHEQPRTGVRVKKGRAISLEKIDSLFAEAEKEMTGGNIRRAIQLYTKILTDLEHKKRKAALELLALARERNGQLAHARAEYKKYLELYPEGEDSERVRQRLAGLMTASASPREKLGKKKRGAYPTQVYGSVSQYYYYDETTDDNGITVVNRSSLSSNMDFNIRKRTASYDIRGLVVGGHDVDFKDSSNDETRVTSLYVDVVDKKRNISGRFGRQSKSTSGVLGRFDGGQMSYNIVPKIKVTGVGGYVVSSADVNDIDTDKYFYGLSLDIGTFASYWDFSPYVIEQKVEGLRSRQAVGAEVRFFHPNATFFSLTDYDIYYDDLNTFLFTGNINLPNKTMINLSADYRNNPILGLNNALQGHVGYTSVKSLDALYSEDELKDIVLNRTSRSKTFMFGVVQPVNTKLQVSADVTASKLSSLDAYLTSTSTLLEAVEGTDFDYYYSLQFIGSSLMKEGDLAIVGFNYTDATLYETYSVNLNTRYPFNRAWRINPRVRVDWRESKRDGTEQFKIRPLLRIDYNMRKPKVRFEVEIGAEWVDNKLPTETEKTSGYFATAGYRFTY